ncbi:DUF6932 family protein [Cryptosporangium sp. NPDC048952]|uniref:DUF6932 family protein n=1 Tax=Cryptosporangium sp. NPDC048952 TaxID=3363961 RepID=UPI003712CFD2
MDLPLWTSDGLLPPGPHAADLSAIYERLVLDAPFRERRELLYAALAVHLRLMRELIPEGRAWIGGGFCVRKDQPPADVDVVILPAEWDDLRKIDIRGRMQLHALLTLQDVAVRTPPIWFGRLQPVGGVLDAFICSPDREEYWHGAWSRVTDARGEVIDGLAKGYAEVTW